MPVLVLVAFVASAGDGVLGIKQTCAVQTGCFPDDAPGFPVTIGNPGSYRLTGALETSDENAGVVAISADDVTLDLGGFRIACKKHVILIG